MRAPIQMPLAVTFWFALAPCVSCGSSGTTPQLGLAVAHDAQSNCGNATPGHTLVWSADGSEIFYVSYTSTATETGDVEIHAARADGSGTRVAENEVVGESYGIVASPPDGSALYYTLGNTLAEGFSQRTLVGGGASVVAASSDDRHIAFGAGDSTSILDTSSAGPFVPAVSGFGWEVLSFSPAGDQLFLANPVAALGATVDLAGNSLGSSSLIAQQTEFVSADWSTEGVLVLFESAGVHQIQNVTTATVTPIVTPIAAPMVALQESTRCAAWTSDGTKVAFWESACPGQPVGGTYCGYNIDGTTNLYLADAASGTTTLVVSGASPGDLAFSPDGTRIAYISGTGAGLDMYVTEVP